MLALIHGKGKANQLDYNCWSLTQISYMLGSTGQSYVVGYGGHPAACSSNSLPCQSANQNSGMRVWQPVAPRSQPPALPLFTDAGDKYPKMVPHRAASCVAAANAPPCGWDAYESVSPNPNVLYGALVGGPDAQDNFVDSRAWGNNMNRVLLVNTAGFTAALAGHKDLSVTQAKCSQSTGLAPAAAKSAQGLRY